MSKEFSDAAAFSDEPGLTRDLQMLGGTDGTEDSGISLVASGKFHDVRTCITSRTTAEQMRDAVLAYARDHPDQKGDDAITMLGAALHRAFCGRNDVGSRL